MCIRKTHRAVLYHDRTHKAVECVWKRPEIFDEIRDVLGFRVIALGVVSSNAKGDPVRVEVQRIQRLGAGEPVKLSSLVGRYPDLTGEMSTDEFLRSIRDA